MAGPIDRLDSYMDRVLRRVTEVLFAIGRVSGWLSQWQEMLLDPDRRIARPRQVYTGEDERDYPA